jgi:hypothetical protein
MNVDRPTGTPGEANPVLDLPGPSRRITVEPVESPETEPAEGPPPDPETMPEPAPERAPEKAPAQA